MAGSGGADVGAGGVVNEEAAGSTGVGVDIMPVYRVTTISHCCRSDLVMLLCKINHLYLPTCRCIGR